MSHAGGVRQERARRDDEYTMYAMHGPTVIETGIPARLDRLPWSGWHTRVVIALGITWVLDGLETTVVGAVAPRLQDRATLHLSDADVGNSASAYLAGAVLGALCFGYLTDRFGRKRLFLVTLGWYMLATLLTAFAWNVGSFELFRFLTGFGIGGEYAAINSTIDELIPAARRGAVDLGINGTFWLGAIVGSAASLVLLDPHVVDQRIGWRLAFGIGAILAFAILFVRRALPESPRWLLGHARVAEAERVLAGIERSVAATSSGFVADPVTETMRIDPERRHSLGDVWHAMIRLYPRRTLVALSLMIAQAFLYNAIFFTASLVLVDFFGVPSGRVGSYIFAFAAGNLLGPLVLGPFFDRVGRKPAIAATYALSGVLLLITGRLFLAGMLDATTIALCWSIVFFVASAAASSAYLTVSETFPVEIRAMAIAIVYGVGTFVGGVPAPHLFAELIATASPGRVVEGYAIAAAMMIAAAVVELVFGVEAAGRRLEDVATPLGASRA